MVKESSIKAIIPGQSYSIETAAGLGLVTIAGDATASLPLATKKSQKRTEVKEEDQLAIQGKIAFWGTDNDFPEKWEEEIEKNDTLADGMEKEIDRIYAGGLTVGYKDKTTKEFTEFMPDELEELLWQPTSRLAFEQFILDYCHHRFPVPEIAFSADKQKVIRLDSLSAVLTRLGRQEVDGYVKYAYYSRNWGRISDIDADPSVARIKVLDPLIDTKETIKVDAALKYIFRTPIAGHRTYYPLVPAYSAKTSRHLDIYAKTVETFDYLLTNQMNPKYHIEIDRGYIKDKYKEKWEDGTPSERNIILKAELKLFHDLLHGPKNSGNNIVTIKYISDVIQAEYSAWTINELKGDTFDEKLLLLLDKCRKHIQTAVGIDPTLQGSNGDTKFGGGGGSDKKAAFNIRMSTSTRHVDHILAVYYWIINYNGYTGPSGERLILKMITPSLPDDNAITPKDRQPTLPEK